MGGVLRRPLLWGALAAGLLVLLAIPALRLHTVEAGVQGLPRDLPVMKVYDRTQKAFPGGPLPAIVAVSAPDVTAPRVAAAIEALKRRALSTGQMQEPISVDISSSRRAARVRIPLAGTGTDDASNRALSTLRGTVIPSTIGRVDGAEAHVTGMTASSRDFNDSMKSHAPIVFAFVLGLAFVLLLVTFRSIVIPLKAIILNMLSVAASYGVLVLVFQDGRLQSFLDFHSIGGVTSWLPLFLFVVLFGLSMDYHVLILSRVREAHEAGMSTARAVDYGIRATAERRHERGDRDGRRVRDLRDARVDRLQDDGRRPGRRRAPGRDGRARGAAPGDHDAARRMELVPPALAGLAATGRPRGAGDGAREAEVEPRVPVGV